jgi:hypothetical protein
MKSNHSLRHRYFRLLQIALIAGGLCRTTPTAHAIVGYVNVAMPSGYTFVANPLHAAPSNSIATVIPNPPDWTRVWLWNITNQTFDAPAIYDAWESGWSLNLLLPPGRGFVVHTWENFTNTFVGEVLQGALTNFIAGTNRLTLVGSKVPQAGALGSTLQFPGTDGDVVSLYPTAHQQFLDGSTYLANYGWFDPAGAADTNGPNLAIASAFFVRHPGPDTNWIRNFFVNPLTANLTAGLQTSGSSSPPPPDIVGLTIINNQATLRLSATNQPFNVQFSTDRVSWITIATNQIGSTWTGACPVPTAGFFQLVSP